MRIYDETNKRELDDITLFLTPEEASQLASDAKDLSLNPDKHHHHMSSEDYQREIILAVYTDENINQFDEESKRIILRDRDKERAFDGEDKNEKLYRKIVEPHGVTDRVEQLRTWVIRLLSYRKSPASPARSSTSSRFGKFSESARRVLSLSEEEAQRFGHSYIGTEHILLGLIWETDGVAAQVLSSLGAELSQLRSAVESIIGRGEGEPDDLGLTPGAKKAIEWAIYETRLSKYTGTEHLLIGLIREGEGTAARVLESLGVSEEKVRAEAKPLNDMYQRQTPWYPDSEFTFNVKSHIKELTRLVIVNTESDLKRREVVLRQLDALQASLKHLEDGNGSLPENIEMIMSAVRDIGRDAPDPVWDRVQEMFQQRVMADDVGSAVTIAILH